MKAFFNFLLTMQIAACPILLAGAGLLFRGVWRSQNMDPGFDAKHVFLLGVDTSAMAATPAAQTALLRRVVDRMQELPEVLSVAWAERPPFIGHNSGPLQMIESSRCHVYSTTCRTGTLKQWKFRYWPGVRSRIRRLSVRKRLPS